MIRFTRRCVTGLISTCVAAQVSAAAEAQDAKQTIRAHLDRRGPQYAELAQKIWDLAEVGYEVTGGTLAVLPNEALARALHANLVEVGGVEYAAAELEFAKTIRASLPEDAPGLETAARVEPFVALEAAMPHSTDVGDVSWLAPTVGLAAATWVPGTSARGVSLEVRLQRGGRT
jgi:metal-dependent amidase/aminoacylase/carboxypeptidase family protein